MFEHSTYAIETAHGNEICAGIRNVGEAQEIAQRHANRLGETVWIYGGTIDDTEGYSVEPEPVADVALNADGTISTR